MTDRPDLRAILAERRAARGGAPLAPSTLPETVGAFTLYGPDSVPGKTGWSMAAWQMWLPGVFGSRDACLLIAGMLLADHDATQKLIVQLRDQYNRATPSVDITVEHILTAKDGLAQGDEDDEEACEDCGWIGSAEAFHTCGDEEADHG